MQTLTYIINPKGTTISKLRTVRKGFKVTIKSNKTTTKTIKKLKAKK